MKRISTLIIGFILAFNLVTPPLGLAEREAESDLDITAVSAILMEPTSGKIIYEKNAHEKLRPASVTKVMTLLLIYDALEDGSIKLEDEVVVSEHAASMGGSQVYLEPNEIQTVEDMLKCVAIASANDASVAMAEHIAGSEEAFVNKMNQRAKELGMEDTNFVNSNGLDEDNHLTSAYDIAVMSRELITKYPEVFDYTTVWQDSIIHKTRHGEEEFGLTSTNKLIKWYDGATGLKTGSTSKAKYCLSGTAERNGMQLIGVVMAAPDYKTRFHEVMKLLDYGFANCSIYKDDLKGKIINVIPVKKGVKEEVNCVVKDDFGHVLAKEDSQKEVTKQVVIPESIEAPIKKGEKIGDLIYNIDGNEIGKVDIIVDEDIDVATFGFQFNKVMKMMFK
ncbi:MAG: D-alanyl-D-alanine carboxypeptidase family protein [Eubacteriales bacterium]